MSVWCLTVTLAYASLCTLSRDTKNTQHYFCPCPMMKCQLLARATGPAVAHVRRAGGSSGRWTERQRRDPYAKAARANPQQPAPISDSQRRPASIHLIGGPICLAQCCGKMLPRLVCISREGICLECATCECASRARLPLRIRGIIIHHQSSP